LFHKTVRDQGELQVVTKKERKDGEGRGGPNNIKKGPEGKKAEWRIFKWTSGAEREGEELFNGGGKGGEDSGQLPGWQAYPIPAETASSFPERRLVPGEGTEGGGTGIRGEGTSETSDQQKASERARNYLSIGMDTKKTSGEGRNDVELARARTKKKKSVLIGETRSLR